MELTLQGMSPQDWPEVRDIYLEGIATGQATFETEAPTWEQWDAAHRADCRIVAVAKNRVVGWAALSPVSDRCAYTGVAEVSVYVAAAARGRGWGKALLDRIIEESERAGIWTLQSGTFPENLASLALQESCGFRRVGVRHRLGRLNGVWRDVVLLERRSGVVGP
jgi:phosphinothricin acetyltransferase